MARHLLTGWELDAGATKCNAGASRWRPAVLV